MKFSLSIFDDTFTNYGHNSSITGGGCSRSQKPTPNLTEMVKQELNGTPVKDCVGFMKQRQYDIFVAEPKY